MPVNYLLVHVSAPDDDDDAATAAAADDDDGEKEKVKPIDPKGMQYENNIRQTEISLHHYFVRWVLLLAELELISVRYLPRV